MISFVIPYRNRPDMVGGFIRNVGGYYEDFEIIIANQDDDKPFLRGQLCNLGFLESAGEIVVFQDVDVRFFKKIDFVGLMEKMKHPFVPFSATMEVEELPNGDMKKGAVRQRPSGFGACAVFTREQFERSNGFSNLPIGWGAEDNIMNKRINYERIQGTIGHVSHKSNGALWTPQHTRNYNLWVSENNRDARLDSFRQTAYESKTRNEFNEKNIFFVSFVGITVVDNFTYKNLF